MGTFMKGRGGLGVTIALLVLCTVFLTSTIAVAAMGVSAYNSTIKTTDSTTAYRTAVAYIANQARRGDSLGGIEIGTLYGADALVIREQYEFATYCTYIYCFGGYLYELYTEEGMQLEMDPEAGTRLIPLDTLTIRADDHGMIVASISCGGMSGYVRVAPRTEVAR